MLRTILTKEVIQLEAFFSGFASIILEVWIWFALAAHRRTLNYYHTFPIVSGVTMILSARRPDDLYYNVMSLVFTVSTILNAYNTYFVHVVMLKDFVETPDPDNLIETLFLPRYKESFDPWGPIAQQVWTWFISLHLVVRSVSLVRLLEVQ